MVGTPDSTNIDKGVEEMKSLKVLHLSDIHIGEKMSNLEDIPYKIGNDIRTQSHNFSKEINAILITGDIFDGKLKHTDTLINNAVRFFDEILEMLNGQMELKVTRKDYIFVPGNHDIIRTENETEQYKKYNTFLEKFYDDKQYLEKHYMDNYSTYKVFEDFKVIIVGFNSVRIEKNDVKSSQEKWIRDEILSKLPLTEDDKKDITNSIVKKISSNPDDWDDYGFISSKQISQIFQKIESEKPDFKSYSLIGALHHHFYPFPEVYTMKGDKSIIRNYSDVISQLQSNNVKIILHGHKHTPVQRMITDNKYFQNAESGIYVFSAGSLGKEDVKNKSFQIIEVFQPKVSKKAVVYNFRYNLSQFESLQTIHIPPKQVSENALPVKLLEELANTNYTTYRKYTRIKEIDNISAKYKVDRIIDLISSCITKFEKAKSLLSKHNEINYLILLVIHYRIVFLDKVRNRSNTYHDGIITDLSNEIKELVKDKYFVNLEGFLNSNLMSESLAGHKTMTSSNSYEERLFSGFITIAQLLTDLFLALSQYGDFFYNDEKIKNKINIKMKPNFFHSQVPGDTIRINADVDRRTTIVEFKSLHPTAHKVAVLIVKYFEGKFTQFEETVKETGVKLYYLSANVSKQGYDLENLNFEAYIPKLLPLLIGNNLYKEETVFVRELVQNSIDAILLRRKIENSTECSEEDIVIEFGKEKVQDIQGSDRAKTKRFIKITDKGIGMDIYKVERYLTCIGRSFYTSEEFEELQKANEIKYNPISNFGIGFLSVFLVAEEVKIKSRYIYEGFSNEQNNYGIEVYIPNYEGCFFVRNLEKKELEYGTEITLYLKEDIHCNEKAIISYMVKTLCDIEIPILINYNNNVRVLKRNNIRKKYINQIYSPLFALQIVKGKVVKLTDLDSRNIMFIKFFNESKWTDLNNGILLNESKKDFLYAPYCDVLINYPADSIQLDMSREKILESVS